MSNAIVYLIPTVLAEDASETIPTYVVSAIQQCEVFFVENERTARRWLKKVWKEMVIDNYSWFTIHKAEEEVTTPFRKALLEGKKIGIISEAGCPGIADPGQLLVAVAQSAGAKVIPLVGPSSILLSLMASGLNGQDFRFRGYLPIDAQQRTKMIRNMEQEAIREGCTQLFIETPYRNNVLVKDILSVCQPGTSLCIASEITSAQEYIVTRTIREWKDKGVPDLHKKPVMFLIGKR